MTQAEHRRERLRMWRLPDVRPVGWPAFPDGDREARELAEVERLVRVRVEETDGR